MLMHFFGSGFAKIGGYDHMEAYMESAGLSEGLLPLVILTEVGAGILLALGYQIHLAAIAIAGFSVLAAIFFTQIGQLRKTCSAF